MKKLLNRLQESKKKRKRRKNRKKRRQPRRQIRENNKSKNDKRLRELEEENKNLKKQLQEFGYGCVAMYVGVDTIAESKGQVDEFMEHVDSPKPGQSFKDYAEYLEEEAKEFKEPSHGLSADAILGEHNKKIVGTMMNS